MQIYCFTLFPFYIFRIETQFSVPIFQFFDQKNSDYLNKNFLSLSLSFLFVTRFFEWKRIYFSGTRAWYRVTTRMHVSYIPADYFCWSGISLGSDVRLGLRIYLWPSYPSRRLSFPSILFLSAPCIGTF